MSRMHEALKVLETRRQAVALETRGDAASISSDPTEAWPDALAAHAGQYGLSNAEPALSLETCELPTTGELPAGYMELARRISEQLAASYCNAILFVTPGRTTDAGLSMTYLAQAFALQSVGDVLLIDGDLGRAHLSAAVCPKGPGVIEVMLGAAGWRDVIHPTTAAQIDFVPCGHAQIPTLERTQFSWGALRSRYRAVLIGVGGAEEPEIAWLAARCEAVYVVVSQSHTTRTTASAAINALRSCGANLLGSVVTEG